MKFIFFSPLTAILIVSGKGNEELRQYSRYCKIGNLTGTTVLENLTVRAA
jgi:hypothetical protein